MEEQENESENFMRDEDTASVTIAYDNLNNGNTRHKADCTSLEATDPERALSCEDAKSVRFGSAYNNRRLVLPASGAQGLLNMKVFTPHITGIS